MPIEKFRSGGKSLLKSDVPARNFRLQKKTKFWGEFGLETENPKYRIFSISFDAEKFFSLKYVMNWNFKRISSRKQKGD